MQVASYAIYNAEKAAIDARMQRLTETTALIQAEMQPKFENASRVAAKARQDYGEAVSKRDKTAQLLHEQTYQFSITRSLLVERLDKLDHEAAPAPVSP
jgi:hypothetical protein